MTQEELAERARLSVQAVGALERGDRRVPRKETVNLLAEALSLSEPERAEFEAAARQRGQIEQTEQAPPGDLIRADATVPALSDENINALESVRRAYLLHLEIKRPLVRYVRGILSQKRLSVPLAGMLLVALLGSALIFNVAVSGRSSLLCGGEIALATDFPTARSYGSNGKPLENAANLAVTQNRDLGGGYTLKVINYDDVSMTRDDDDPARGARNMASVVKNACIVAMVGPFNSDAAQTEIPIAANAGLAMISPSNTNPGLTLRQYASESLHGVSFDQLHPAGKTTNYFRITANDAFQMTADADFTAGELAARRVYVVVSRPSPYGGLLVGGFTTEFLEKGGTIVATENLEWHDPAAFPALAARIAAAAPDAVYFGGIVDGGGAILKKELVQHGYRGPFVAGDGIALDPRFIELAGADAAQNTYATVAEPDVSDLRSDAAARFLSDYRNRYPSQQVTGDCANAYDAAMIEITAIKNLIRMGHPVTRAAVIDQIQNIQYTGVTGAIRFDKNGDDVYGAYTVYIVQNGAWVAYARVSV